MKLKWTRVACAALTVAALGGALSGCVALVAVVLSGGNVDRGVFASVLAGRPLPEA